MPNTTTTTNKKMSTERHEILTTHLKTIYQEFRDSNTPCIIAFESSDNNRTTLLANGKKPFLHFIVSHIFIGINEAEDKS